MDAEKLMNENPLTKNKLKEWFLDRLMASANEFEQDDSFKEFMIKSGITDDQIITIFKEGGRASLDMFDENDVWRARLRSCSCWWECFLFFAKRLAAAFDFFADLNSK